MGRRRTRSFEGLAKASKELNVKISASRVSEVCVRSLLKCVAWLGAGVGCFGILGGAGEAAGRPVGHMMRPVGHMMMPVAGQHNLTRLQHGMAQRAGQFGMRHRRGFGRSQAFGWGYGSPYFAGTFETAPPEAGYGGPLWPPPPFYPYPPPFAALPPPCITPLVIELRHRRRHKLPRVVYGSPDVCPPPLIAKAH